MIGAGLLSWLFSNGRAAPSPAAPEPPAPDRYDSPSRTELRCALACFDLVDGVVRAEGRVPTEDEDRAWAYAEWCLARAAERYGRAYVRAADARDAP